jgi:TATA-box binding protein (TBP) (component of TFIID and TFIIIB)
MMTAAEELKVSPLRISTMTVIGHLGAIPDLQRLYDAGAMIPYWWIGEGILKIEYAGQRKGVCSEDILHTSTKEKKRFFNQSSLVFRLCLQPMDSAKGPQFKETTADEASAISLIEAKGPQFKETTADEASAISLIEAKGPQFKETTADEASVISLIEAKGPQFKETNIKLFKNGGFQMTGISSEAMARSALTQLIAMNRDRGIWPSGEGLPTPHIQRFDTCMINSDYSIDKAIRRDRLYRVLVEDYGLWSTYEPTIYQGVNTKFFWNKARTAGTPPGICVCPTPCDGDGSGYAIGQCKKITIAPFRTGKIIITGAKHVEQLDDAYNFMNEVFRTHAEHVLRDEAEPVIVDTPVSTKKKPVVKMDNVEAILRQKMRASPRNVVRLATTAAVIA